MLAIASVFVIAIVSLLITRVATVALTLTGLSQEVARFQARSALSGAGFTTGEAESVVSHPIRRRIIMALMLTGSVGIAASAATLMLSFVDADRTETLNRLALLFAALLAVYLIARSDWVGRQLAVVIAKVLGRWTELDTQDYAALLHVGGDFAVMEIPVHERSWLTGRTVRDLDLRREGVVLLGLTRPDGSFIGAPSWETTLAPGDMAIIYGRRARICELDHRPPGAEGDAAHERAVRAAPDRVQ